MKNKNMLPSNNTHDLDSVVSHSCASGNSIEQVKNILHLYLGCSVVHRNYQDSKLIKITSIHSNGEFNAGKDEMSKNIRNYKLVLRPLTDMSEEEKNELELYQYENMQGDNNQPQRTALVIKWYLERAFDLFHLIENGFAIGKPSKS
jgi:hypothetical protein